MNAEQGTIMKGHNDPFTCNLIIWLSKNETITSQNCRTQHHINVVNIFYSVVVLPFLLSHVNITCDSNRRQN